MDTILTLIITLFVLGLCIFIAVEGKKQEALRREVLKRGRGQ